MFFVARLIGDNSDDINRFFKEYLLAEGGERIQGRNRVSEVKGNRRCVE